MAHYLKAVHNPDTVHAMCDDYRAGATIDNQLDEADRGRRKITCLIQALWSLQGELEKWHEVLGSTAVIILPSMRLKERMPS